MFFENTKDYFLMAVPISIISFLALHFIYKVLDLFRVRVKSLLKFYSLLYGIILVSIVQNISRLSFIACHNLLNMFSFNTMLYAVQGVTILYLGFMIILSTSFFYMMKYLYRKKIKYLPFNLKKLSLWPTTLLICYVFRPII